MNTYRVSHLSSFARFREDEDLDINWLVQQILGSEETEAMRKGTAFHKYLEHAAEGEVPEFTIDGYRFIFTADLEIALPPWRETRLAKDYGGLLVSGQADVIAGRTIYDHKTTERFDAENYLYGWQHKFYLDIFDADRFVWNAWEMKEEKPKAYQVYGLHQLTQYRYPALSEDCTRLAQDFKTFADRFLPNYSFDPKPSTVMAQLRQSLEMTT